MKKFYKTVVLVDDFEDALVTPIANLPHPFYILHFLSFICCIFAAYLYIIRCNKMNKIRELLRSPYPTLYQRWKAVVIPSVIIFLILYLLQPFGISQISHGRFWIVLGSALVAASASGIFAYLLPALFPSYYKEQNWTLGKYLLNLLQLLLLISIGIWAYNSWLFGGWLNVSRFFTVLFWVMLLAPFPTVFFLMWNRNLLLTRNLREAMEMNACLSGKALPAETEAGRKEEKAHAEALTFLGSTKEALEVEAESFLYAEAEGNYVKVCYDKDGQPRRKVLRITMKQMEETVAGCPFVMRCHRAFLVNAGRVRKVDGNSQGYRLIYWRDVRKKYPCRVPIRSR